MRHVRRRELGYIAGIERRHERVCTWEPIRRVLLEQHHHSTCEIGRRVRAMHVDRRWPLTDLFDEQSRRAWRVERQLTREHLVPYDTERVEVRPAIDVSLTH